MGISLPKIAVGRFLRKTVAPLIPGGADAAESINSAIKQVKTGIASGQGIIPATQAALHNVNADAEKRKWMTYALIGGFAILLVFLARRR